MTFRYNFSLSLFLAQFMSFLIDFFLDEANVFC